MIELEKTYLAKYLPDGLIQCTFKPMVDIYLPQTSEHPTLRLRKQGDRLEMTKKTPMHDNDSSVQIEQTITLSKEEYTALLHVPGKKVVKTRYYYEYQEVICEIDVFSGDLHGLVVVDVEFASEQQKNEFCQPGFCLVEVTQDDFIAGGMLCGKSYTDISAQLEKYDYIPLFL